MHKTIKNVPIPSTVFARRGGGRRRKYPFDTMEVDEMFFVPNRAKNNLTTHVSAVGKRLNRKFVTRLLYMRDTEAGWEACEEDAEGAILGVGVWRVE